MTAYPRSVGGTFSKVQALWGQRVGGYMGLPGLLRELGVDPAPLLASAGLAPDALSHPEKRIPYGALGRLLEQSAQAANHPQLGLITGQMWHVSDLGLVGEIVRHSATVGEALQVLTVYQHLNSGGGLAFALRRAAVVDLGYAIYYPGITGADHLYDGALAAGFNFMRELAGAAWTPSEIFFSHAKPHSQILYRNLFRVMPRFNVEFSAIRFPAYWLDRPVDGADPARKQAALAALDVAMPDLLERVHRGLRTLLLSGKSSGDDLAQMLSMHRHTLNRRLRQLGTTFQGVLDDVRFEVARQLLSYSDLALDDIAASLGYAGVSPFMRTFRRWTGVTPGQWRRFAAEEKMALHPPWIDPVAPSVGRGGAPVTPAQGHWSAPGLFADHTRNGSA